MAADGVRTGRLPVVTVGALESTVGDGGVKSGVVSDSGACAGAVGSETEEGTVGSGTEEAAQENKLIYDISIKHQ